MPKPSNLSLLHKRLLTISSILTVLSGIVVGGVSLWRDLRTQQTAFDQRDMGPSYMDMKVIELETKVDSLEAFHKEE